jgi:hypothetical protein
VLDRLAPKRLELSVEPRVRSHCRFRNRGTEYVGDSGITWMSASTKRQCDRALVELRQVRRGEVRSVLAHEGREREDVPLQLASKGCQVLSLVHPLFHNRLD